VCRVLENSYYHDVTSNLVILCTTVVITVYNLDQLRRSTFSKLAGRKAYVLLLLLPLFHASLSPLVFLSFQKTELFIIEIILCLLNVLGLRAYIEVAKLAAGGVLVVQESTEVITLSDSYVKMRCVPCLGFGSLWFLYVFLNRVTYVFFLQPIFMMADTFLMEIHIEEFLQLSFVFLALDLLVIVISFLAAWNITWMLRPISNLQRTWLKMFYMFLIIVFTQIPFSVTLTLIHVHNCDFKSAMRGLFFRTSVKMLFLGILGSFTFPLSDLLLIKNESVQLLSFRPEREHIEFVI